MICGATACMPCHAKQTSLPILQTFQFMPRWQACCIPIVVHVQLDVLPGNHIVSRSHDILVFLQAFDTSGIHRLVRVKQATLRTSAWQEVPRRARVHRIMSVQSQNLFCVYPFLVQASCNVVFAPKSFAARIHVPHGGGLVGTESTCGASLSAAPLYCQSRSPVVYAKQKAALVP